MCSCVSLIAVPNMVIFYSDRHQLVQQIQMIGGGALGQQAATAVRHVAAQNGVWSLGNFGGVPPKSAMVCHQPGTNPIPGDTPSNTNVQLQQQQVSQDGSILPNMVEEPDYRFVFNSCTVGMVRKLFVCKYLHAEILD
jgi:hypothetical protein